MPKYTYKCKCGNVFERIVTYEERTKLSTCKKCFKQVKRSLSVPMDFVVNELADRYKKKHIKKDVTQIMKKRSVDHVREHELGKMIEKHGLKEIKKTKYWKGKK